MNSSRARKVNINWDDGRLDSHRERQKFTLQLRMCIKQVEMNLAAEMCFSLRFPGPASMSAFNNMVLSWKSVMLKSFRIFKVGSNDSMSLKSSLMTISRCKFPSLSTEVTLLNNDATVKSLWSDGGWANMGRSCEELWLDVTLPIKTSHSIAEISGFARAVANFSEELVACDHLRAGDEQDGMNITDQMECFGIGVWRQNIVISCRNGVALREVITNLTIALAEAKIFPVLLLEGLARVICALWNVTPQFDRLGYIISIVPYRPQQTVGDIVKEKENWDQFNSFSNSPSCCRKANRRTSSC